MTAPHEHADLCAALRGPGAITTIDWPQVADTIDDLHARLAAMEAERDLYRDAADVLRESATLYLTTLHRDRRSLSRLLADVTAPTPEVPHADR